MAADDGPRRGQSEPTPSPLGREVGVKNPSQILLGDSTPLVCKTDLQVGFSSFPVGVEGDSPGRNKNVPSLRHCLKGINRQVLKDLSNLHFVDLDWRKVRLDLENRPHRAPVQREEDSFLKDLFDRLELSFQRGRPRKLPELLNHLPSAQDRSLSLVQPLHALFRDSGATFLHQRDIP